jgi:hypothetical protein
MTAMANHDLAHRAIREALNDEATVKEILEDAGAAFESHLIAKDENGELDIAEVKDAVEQTKQLLKHLRAFLTEQPTAQPTANDQAASAASAVSAQEGRDLADRLEELAIEVVGSASDPQDWITTLAYQLSRLARQARENYERLLPAEGKTPTAAQGVAIARFVRSRSAGQATITLGVLGLPDNFIHVRFPDGHEGGIDPEGRTST